MLCASFKIKIEFQGRVKIVDELKRGGNFPTSIVRGNNIIS